MWFDFLVIAAVFRAFQMLFRRRRKLHDGSDGLLKLKVAKTFQAVYGGNVYQALRIPDTGHRGHQVIDALLLTDREMYIFSIQNLSGIVRVCNDGTWMETDMTGNAIAHPNAVTQLQEKASVLAQYIARRGVPLPEKSYNLKVVFVNPSCRPEQEILLQPEVLSYDRWEDIIKKGSRSAFFGIHMNSTMALKNRNDSHPLHSQLQFILSTAPTFDRLELRGGGILFGEFKRFKGSSRDLEALAMAKRSKISHYEIFHQSTFWDFLGIHTNPDVRVVCTLRDYRQGATVQPARAETLVKGDLEIVFQISSTTKQQNFGIRDIAILALRA